MYSDDELGGGRGWGVEVSGAHYRTPPFLFVVFDSGLRLLRPNFKSEHLYYLCCHFVLQTSLVQQENRSIIWLSSILKFCLISKLLGDRRRMVLFETYFIFTNRREPGHIVKANKVNESLIKG